MPKTPELIKESYMKLKTTNIKGKFTFTEDEMRWLLMLLLDQNNLQSTRESIYSNKYYWDLLKFLKSHL